MAFPSVFTLAAHAAKKGFLIPAKPLFLGCEWHTNQLATSVETAWYLMSYVDAVAPHCSLLLVKFE